MIFPNLVIRFSKSQPVRVDHFDALGAARDHNLSSVSWKLHFWPLWSGVSMNRDLKRGKSALVKRAHIVQTNRRWFEPSSKDNALGVECANWVAFAFKKALAMRRAHIPQAQRAILRSREEDVRGRVHREWDNCVLVPVEITNVLFLLQIVQSNVVVDFVRSSLF